MMSGLDASRPLKDAAEEERLFRNRAGAGFAIIVALTLGLAARYFYLQLLQHDNLSARSETNRVQIRAVAPNRGLVYDRRGRVLAENRPAYRIEVIPEKAGDLEATLDQLAGVIALTREDRQRFERARQRYREFQGVPLRFNLDEREVSRFAVNRHLFEGVELVPYLSRHYPHGELLTHVLGYVGRLDAQDVRAVEADNYQATTHIGKLGVEKAYEHLLHGDTGLERVETNALGRVLRVLERRDPLPGSDILLSIDLAVQRAAWDAMGERAGALVAIDPRDGGVISLVSKPAFDPNDFARGISRAGFKAVLEDPYQPMFNRALAGSYEPGSTLKPFVGLAGLELGAMERDRRVYSSGEYYLPDYDRPFRDWKDGGHGWVDIRQALEESVNTYFYQVAYVLGIDRLHDYLAQFGFGQRTGIDIPGEAAGLLPSRTWKRDRYGEPWYPGETVIAGIGQGFNLATPLQLASALATLVSNGRRLAPRVLYAVKHPGGDAIERERSPEREPIAVRDPANWDVVLEGMLRVVNGVRGTARDVSLNADYMIAGKTGTAQVYMLARDRDAEEEGEVEEALRDHALFIAFAPFGEPRIVVAVVVDHGGAGSSVAAPIARAALDAWLGQEQVQ